MLTHKFRPFFGLPTVFSSCNFKRHASNKLMAERGEGKKTMVLYCAFVENIKIKQAYTKTKKNWEFLAFSLTAVEHLSCKSNFHQETHRCAWT